jgi:hypothetical protein
VHDEIRQFSTESTFLKNQQIVDSELLDANQALKKSGKLKFAFAWNLRGGVPTQGQTPVRLKEYLHAHLFVAVVIVEVSLR